MTVTISDEYTKLFEQNGYSYDDMQASVNHYRDMGLSDNEIQAKIDNRISEFKQVSINQRALDNTVDISPDDPYVKTGNYNLDKLSSAYFTPDELKEMDNKGPIGWWELAKKADKSELIPFSGDVEAGVKATKLNIISNKIENGEEISDADKQFLDNYLRNYIEVSRRGTTWGAKVANVLMEAPAWVTEIALISLATGGGGTIPSAAKKVAAKSGTKAALKYTTKALIKSAQKAGVKGAAVNIAKSNVILAPRVYENYAQRRISDGIAITDKGEYYLKEIDEKPATTLLKALADTNIEAGTELIAGQYLNLAGSLAATSKLGKATGKVLNNSFTRAYAILPKNTRVALESAVQKLRPNETVESLIKKGGFNGVLEEMGEERIADILKTTLDLDEEKGYSADQFMRAINPGADELLVELGAFSIMGGISRSGSILYNNLRSKGYSDAEAKNTVNNLSEIEKDNWVNDEIVKDNYTVNSDITQKDIQEYEASVDNKTITLEGKVEYNENQINESNYFSDTKQTISDEQKAIYKNYSQIVEKIIQNPKNYKGQIELGDTPKLLQEAGLDNLPLETSSQIINKMMKKKGHDLKSKTIKNLPYLLNNPVAVFKSNTEENSVIALLDAQDKNGLPVMIAIEKNNNKGINEVNFITSGYGRKQNFFKRLLNENKLIKVRQKNIPDWLQESFDSNNSISDNHNSVNTVPTKDINSITDDSSDFNTHSEKLTPEQEYENAKKEYKEYEKVKKAETSIVNKVLAPISTELDVINPKLKHALRRYELDTALNENEYVREIKPFIDKVKKMSKEDYNIYDLALKNRNTKTIDYLNNKYNIKEEFTSVRKLLDKLYNEAKGAGMNIGMIEGYFPRKVINPAKFLDEVSKNSFIKKALKELDPDNTMTAEEKAQAVNNLMRGYGSNKITLAGSGFTKERRVQGITPELNRYYKDSLLTLADYVRGMNENIQARKFFGKGENVEKSVGAYVKNLTDEGLISASQEQRAKELLMARFNQRGVSNSWLAGYRDVMNTSLLANPFAAMTQLGDYAFTIYKNGGYDSFIGFAKSLTRNHITREDLGIDKIAQELSEKSKTSFIANLGLKISTFDAMDKMGKETFINASYRRIKRLAEKPTKEFDEMLKEIFGKEAKQLKEDLKNNVLSRNVKYLLFSDLSDFQPISLAEMPQVYLTSGNGRLFYMLKTYTIKQFDIYRNECFRKMEKNPVEGLSNLIRLSACLMLCNATRDTIVNFLLNRPFDLEDMVVDNLLRLVGFSKWQVYTGRKEGFMKVFLASQLPPYALIDDLVRDGLDISAGKYPYEKPISHLRTIKDIPLAGKLYYWWFGGGSDIEEKSGSYRKFSENYNKAKKANDTLKDLDSDLLESFYQKNQDKLENYQILKSYNKQIQRLKKQRKQLEKLKDKEAIKNIDAQIDEISKAGLEALK